MHEKDKQNNESIVCFFVLLLRFFCTNELFYFLLQFIPLRRLFMHKRFARNWTLFVDVMVTPMMHIIHSTVRSRFEMNKSPEVCEVMYHHRRSLITNKY